MNMKLAMELIKKAAVLMQKQGWFSMERLELRLASDLTRNWQLLMVISSSVGADRTSVSELIAL